MEESIMKLIRTRECDGACCVESPRFPNADRSDCIFHVNNGCDIKRGVSELPTGMSPVRPNLTTEEEFEDTCVGWPQNCPPHKQNERNNGKCCLQWVKE